MSDVCCTAAHNLEIVRTELEKAREEIRQLRKYNEDLEVFQRLCYTLVRAGMPKTYDRR